MPEIRDQRKPGWLWADRDIIKRDGGQLGPHVLAVYMALCAFAGDEQTAWPSHATLAEVTGMSRRHVMRCLKKLEAANWIGAERRRSEDGDLDSNIYTLLAQPGGGSDRESLPVVTGSQQGSDRESHKRKPLNESQLNDNSERKRSSSKPLTAGLKYCLEQFSRKRFSTKGQRETLAACEQEVGTDAFKRAVDWLANFSGLDANKLCTAARKFKEGNTNGRTTQHRGTGRSGGATHRSGSTRPEAAGDELSDWERQYREHVAKVTGG